MMVPGPHFIHQNSLNYRSHHFLFTCFEFVNRSRCTGTMWTKLFSFCLLFALSTLCSYAQTVSVTISGSTENQADKSKLPFVNLVVKKEKDSAFVTGTVSNEEGRFSLANIPSGEYLLELSYAGFQTKTQRMLVGSLSPFLDLGTIELPPDSRQLQEVVLTSKEEELSNRMDKKTFQGAANISQSGGSVLQALKGLPGITTSQEGKVELRGSDKVAILIDGRQTALTGFGSQTGLDNIPASNIEKIEIINNIGDVYRKKGRFREAMSYTLKAAQMARDMNEQYQLASAYRDLSKTFDLQGKYDSAYHYSEAGRDIFLTIFSEDNKKQLLLLQTLFEIEQKDNAILQFEKDKKTNTVLIIAAVMIILLILCLAITIISRQRLKLILYESQKKAMGDDLELKSKELTSHTLHLIQKNQLLDQLKSKLTEMIKDDKRDQRKELKQVINLITINSNQEKNWDDFRIIFERVHENFFESLKKHTTALTSSELRLVALLKMNLSSADIATMLGISQDSLRIARYRLRKKLNLEEGENLSAFIQRL